jgi:hypothetical protein
MSSCDTAHPKNATPLRHPIFHSHCTKCSPHEPTRGALPGVPHRPPWHSTSASFDPSFPPFFCTLDTWNHEPPAAESIPSESRDRMASHARHFVFLAHWTVGLILPTLAVVIRIKAFVDAHSTIMAVLEILGSTNAAEATVTTMIGFFVI